MSGGLKHISEEIPGAIDEILGKPDPDDFDDDEALEAQAERQSLLERRRELEDGVDDRRREIVQINARLRELKRILTSGPPRRRRR